MQMEGKKLGGRYEIVSRVGGGGMAVVYKAKDLLLNRYVAIKILSEALSNDSEFIRRFSREAQSAAALSHPNVVNVYDVGRDGFTHYIVMELVDGPTLKQYIQERGPLPVQEAAAIAVQICDGLAHAHENQIVHRDIKPHNILLGSNGRVKVTDFGIARAASSSTITQTGSVMGSVHYFSPEQARGGVIGEKSDLYSLGIVMYEMLTGQLPFDGDSAISIALKHLQEHPQDPRELNPNIPDEVADLVIRALDKDPNNRFASAREMMKAIQYTVKMDSHLEGNWMRSPSRQQHMYQTIPLADDEQDQPVATALEPKHSYQSPIQRPEIRSGHTRNEARVPNSIGDKTMANLERLRNVPNDGDKTIFQRTVIWLENVQANLPWWQKLLFGFITVVIILFLSAWGFNTIWGLFSGGDGENGVNATETTIPKFGTIKEAKEFAKEHGLKEPKVFHKPTDEANEGEVFNQVPEPGANFDKNTQIEVYVAKAGIKVPNYIGQFESHPRDDRIKARLEGYKIHVYWCADGASQGAHRVYDQDPKPGQSVAKGGILKVYVHTPSIPAGCTPANYNR